MAFTVRTIQALSTTTKPAEFNMQILLIDNDISSTSFLKKSIEKTGYCVDCETDCLFGQERAVTHNYDLIVLDLTYFPFDGLALCRNIREEGKTTPILALTSDHRKYLGIYSLDCGADDYLVKPIEYLELYARIRALIRRSHGHPSVEIILGNLRINTSQKRVFFQDSEVPLTSKEYGILEYLAINRNGIVTKRMLEDHVWGSENKIFSNVPEVIISRIRKKLSSDNKEDVIKTAKGLGYTIRE